MSKSNTRRSLKAFPASDFNPARSLKVHRRPAGRSCSKSYDQLRLSIHRPAPFAGQSITNGAVVSRGSPSGTIGSEKRAVTCLTCFTVPRGEKCTTDGGPPPTATGTLRSATAVMMDNAATAKRANNNLD